MKRGRWVALGVAVAILMGSAILWQSSTPARPAISAVGKRASAGAGDARVRSQSPSTDPSKPPRPRDLDDASDGHRPLAPRPRITRDAIRDAAREALPWRYPGLCSDSSRSGPLSPRARYLATFVRTPLELAVVHRDPDVDASLAEDIQNGLGKIQHRTKIGLEAPFPAIYVYPTVEALREHSCASANVRAYYDGAIHVAATGGILRGLQHEYTHHVLVTNGIERPLWLQEGLAMLATHEVQHETRAAWLTWKDRPLSMERMVNLFPATAEPEEVATFYGQAYHMTQMLERLCLARAGCGPMELFGALRSGEATPDTLFEWAVQRRGADLVAKTRVPVWADYLAHGNFGRENYRALLARASVSAF